MRYLIIYSNELIGSGMIDIKYNNIFLSEGRVHILFYFTQQREEIGYLALVDKAVVVHFLLLLLLLVE